MVKIEKGGVYTATIARTGVSSRGDWELIQVRDKGTRSITIWPENKPTGIEQGDEFIVEEILVVKNGARKMSDGSWREDCSVEAVVRKTNTVNRYDFDIDSMTEPDTTDSPLFKELVGDDGGDLPF